MIACIHPCSSSANHTLNTLWYADRLKNRENDEKPKLLQMVLEEEKIRGASKERPPSENSQANNKRMPHRLTEEEIDTEQKLKVIKNEVLDFPRKGIESSDEESESETKNVKDDLSVMKQTMMKEKVPEEFFEFHERVNQLLEDQDRLINYHMKVIKEDASLLSQESEIFAKLQNVNTMDIDIENYISSLDGIVGKKLKMYGYLSRMIEKLKIDLKNEEEISSKMKETFYM